MSEVIVKAPFADTIATSLKKGDEATVIPVDLLGEQYTGIISLISRSNDPSNRTIEVWINLPNKEGKLRANGAAQVILTTHISMDSIVVPVAAVTLDASTGTTGHVITVDDQSTAHDVKVKTGIRTESEIQILSGLEGNETVVVEGNYALPDGTKVQVSEKEKDEENGGEEKPGAGGDEK